jgi:Fic/DOC family
MRYLTLGEIVELHRQLLQATGGAPGIRDFGALQSAIAQPKATFGGVDLYPTLAEKAAALCFSLRWKPFWSSTALRSMPPSMTKSASSWISPLAGSVETN